MEANAIVLTQEQYEQMRESLKAELMNELEKLQPSTTRGIYTPEWIGVREDLESLLQSDYNNGCGHWYQNQQGLYAAFRLAFRKERASHFRFIEQGRMRNFYSELMALINKYRSGQDLTD
ncbi:hypothetical protein [Paenibacillus vini]|uniref:Uncharacterized protein n=1 Tax=Paenibacillus vini TaxID=1476024 RepID=A0ABQ4MIU5_9BACL|nr:hypothetical protein [Paenibacillus vini]GIP55903.1 hypothetical protein J42TS3_49380 [Paenibacillus vini]